KGFLPNVTKSASTKNGSKSPKGAAKRNVQNGSKKKHLSMVVMNDSIQPKRFQPWRNVLPIVLVSTTVSILRSTNITTALVGHSTSCELFWTNRNSRNP